MILCVDKREDRFNVFYKNSNVGTNLLVLADDAPESTTTLLVISCGSSTIEQTFSFLANLKNSHFDRPYGIIWSAYKLFGPFCSISYYIWPRFPKLLRCASKNTEGIETRFSNIKDCGEYLWLLKELCMLLEKQPSITRRHHASKLFPQKRRWVQFSTLDCILWLFVTILMCKVNNNTYNQ